MDYKKSVIQLLIGLFLSPVLIYILLGLARLTGSTYEMTNGETFIIWLLMAIFINLSIVKRAWLNTKKKKKNFRAFDLD